MTGSRSEVFFLEQNICHFIPFHKDCDSIHTINFVLETRPQDRDALRSESVYKMYYVCGGKGFLHVPGRVMPIGEGDIFFTFPAVPFRIEPTEGLTFMYISFTGLRGNMIMEKLKIGSRNFLFPHGEAVYEFWRAGLSADAQVSDLMSEAVLLYTFAFLGSRLLPDGEQVKKNNVVGRIKKYIDDNFTDPDFSLDDVSRELSYNSKYISHVFKKHMGIGVIDYLNMIRIQNACTMMEQGFTSINDIAGKCGYADAQYFSKVFRDRMGLAPLNYLRSLQK